jgi:DNA-binding phage protein
MLAITERLVTDHGLEWVFCDTDSMAIARSAGMDVNTFNSRVAAIRGWFGPLNPYRGRAGRSPILKLEDANYGLDGDTAERELAPLYCLAISAKRYALFNLDGRGRPVLRKASAHGLGHLRDPYDGAPSPPDIPAPAEKLAAIGAERWQHDVWYRIICAALDGHAEQVALADLPNFGSPAVSRYAATTPALLRWFRRYNRGKPYREQVRPFGFMLAFQAKRLDWQPEAPAVTGAAAGESRRPAAKALLDAPRAVAPFDRNPARAAAACFDRETGKPVHRRLLKTYSQTLLRYHLHPDRKFLRADYTDRGLSERRHVQVTSVQLIGKEANRWEEQFYLGGDPEAQSEFGFAAEDVGRLIAAVQQTVKTHGIQGLARKARVSRQHLAAIVDRKVKASQEVMVRLCAAAAVLDAAAQLTTGNYTTLLVDVRQRCRHIGLRSFARQAGISSGHLARLLADGRHASAAMQSRLRTALAEPDGEMSSC